MVEQSKFKIVLRWTGFLPIAIIATFVAVASIRIPQLAFSNQNDLISKAITECSSAIAGGMAFIYVEAKTAPAHQKKVAYLLAAFSLVFAGGGIIIELLNADYWALFSGISMILGVCYMTYRVIIGESDLEK